MCIDCTSLKVRERSWLSQSQVNALESLTAAAGICCFRAHCFMQSRKKDKAYTSHGLQPTSDGLQPTTT